MNSISLPTLKRQCVTWRNNSLTSSQSLAHLQLVVLQDDVRLPECSATKLGLAGINYSK